MAKVQLESPVPVDPEQLWNLIGQFNALPEWHPAVQSCELEEGGRLRRLHLLGGGEIIERLEQIEQGDRMYRYSIVSGPLPVANYTATLRVREDSEGKAIVEWSSTFDPAGASENDAVKSVQDMYAAGFDNLRKMFGM